MLDFITTMIPESLNSQWTFKDHNERPAMFGAPNEGELIEEVNQIGGWSPVQFI